MPTKMTRFGLLALAITAAQPRNALAQVSQSATWDSVAAVLQTSAAQAAGYYRFSLPRRDVQLRMGDVSIATSMAAGAWAGFSGDGRKATVMGDLVLLASELGPALRVLAERDIDVTAIHNHLVGAEPQLAYVHFHAHGSAVDLARRLAAAVALTATPLPVASAAPQPLSIDTARVFQVLGPGRAQGSVAQVSLTLVPGRVLIGRETVVPALGYGTPINIQAVSSQRAVATGDFAVLAAQVDPVLDTMAAHGITATAVHSHLISESPTIYYIHFWADGPLEAVLSGLRAVIQAARGAV